MHALPTHTPDEVRAALDDVVDELGRREGYKTWQDRLGEYIFDFLEWLGDLLGLEPGAFDGAGRIVYWGLIAVAVLLLLFLVFLMARAATGPRHGRRVTAGISELVASRLRALYDEARRAEQEGDRVRALRLYFFALVVGLGERGDLAYRDAWTNRELLERGEPDAEVRERLRPLVGHLDAVSFGDREASVEDVRGMQDLCRRWLGEEVA